MPWAWAVLGLAAIQLLAGLLNVALLAPVWMQVVHLRLADALWIALVLLAAQALALTSPVMAPDQAQAAGA